MIGMYLTSYQLLEEGHTYPRYLHVPGSLEGLAI